MKLEARSHVKKEKKKKRGLIYNMYTQYNILSVC